MPGSLNLVVGTTTYSRPLGATNAKINAAIRRYCIAKDIAVEGRTAAEIASDFLESLANYVMTVSSDQQRKEIIELEMATTEQQVADDNLL